MFFHGDPPLGGLESKLWGLTPRQKRALLIGGALLALGAVAGPLILQVTIGGLIVNGLLWMLIKDSDLLMGIMNKHGAKIDTVVTLGGILGGGATSAVGWLTGVMIGGFFTVFRQLFTTGENESSFSFGFKKKEEPA